MMILKKEILMNFIKNKLDKKSQSQKQELDLEKYEKVFFPPFSSAISIANGKIRFLKNVILIGSVLFIVIILIQQHEIHVANKTISNQNYLILPVPNYMHAKPGVIPDDVLFAFANWAVKQVEDFDYTTVRSQYKDVEIYMSPEMRVKFAFENEKKINKYEKFQMRQIFSYMEPKTLLQKTNSKGDGYFEVEFYGKLHRYTNDQTLAPVNEKLLIKFGTAPIDKPNKSWMFEVIDIERVADNTDSDDDFALSSAQIPTQKGAL